jgi:hypothetical protein
MAEFKFIKVYEHKLVGDFIVAKAVFPVWLNHGKTLSESFARTVIFIPEDREKQIEISTFLEYENIPEKYRADDRAQFGGHLISNLKDWNDSGDSDQNCSNYEQFKTSLDIERYLEEHPCGWW